MKQIKITDQDTSKSFTFYDNSNGTILRKFDGFEYPQVLTSIEDIAKQNGAYYSNSKFGKRRLSFQGDLVGANKFQQRKDLLAVARQLGQMKLFEVISYDDLLLRFEAEITRLTMPYTHQIHSFLFELEASDYRFYSQDEIVTDFTANELIVLENEGTEATNPIFTITGSGTTIEVANLSTGESFEIGAISSSQEVIIDTMKRIVTLDGGSNYSIFSGDFFMLEPGNNGIEFLVTGNDSNTKLEVKHRHAYNGL